MRYSSAAILGVMLMAACAADRPADFDGSYLLADIDGQALPGTADLTIEGSRIHGSGPCNNYFGQNGAAWPDVDFAAIGSTRRACLTEGGEARYFEALGQVETAERTGDGLILRGPGGRLTFTAG